MGQLSNLTLTLTYGLLFLPTDNGTLIDCASKNSEFYPWNIADSILRPFAKTESAIRFSVISNEDGLDCAIPDKDWSASS